MRDRGRASVGSPGRRRLGRRRRRPGRRRHGHADDRAARRTSTARTSPPGTWCRRSSCGTLQYATLTDKAADDFATIPGLAESWEASDDGLTYTYTLREGLQWSDGEPLTAEDIAYTINRSRDEEWLNHSATVANLEATAIDERTRRDHVVGARPEAADDGRLHRPQAHLRGALGRRRPTYDALDGVGSGPYTLEEWEPGAVVDDGRQPELLRLGRRRAADRPHRVPRVRQRRGDGRRAAGRRDRRRPQHPAGVVRRASTPTTTSSPSPASRAGSPSWG